jgi:hypothetical protein
MTNYANEVYFVLDPNGNEKLFITARDDYRTEKALATEVPRYFGSDFVFVRKLIVASGLTKDQAESGRRTLCAYFKAMGRSILNRKDAPMLLVDQ